MRRLDDDTIAYVILAVVWALSIIACAAVVIVQMLMG